ncbi:hypothetical protein GDO86_013990 [Hymenochirus boettgeri]|uniref:Uncharacterized protein n=1 Tax=Hymenochirus boettgeri TaxID=247094 RepID=A0A8T2JMC7_9PIPI|nr:hypothetical protein GDO86_013990 [Hymenochirus boettgeri]
MIQYYFISCTDPGISRLNRHILFKSNTTNGVGRFFPEYLTPVVHLEGFFYYCTIGKVEMGHRSPPPVPIKRQLHPHKNIF